VAGTYEAPIDRKRDVHSLLDQSALIALSLKDHLTIHDRLVDLASNRSKELAGLRFVLGLQFSDFTVRECKRTFVAAVCNAHGFEFVKGRCRDYCGESGFKRSRHGSFIERGKRRYVLFSFRR
jgi:hypothetical protein